MPPSPTGSRGFERFEAQPRVGLPTYVERAAGAVWDRPAALLPQSYVAAVAGAGGLPVLLHRWIRPRPGGRWTGSTRWC